MAQKRLKDHKGRTLTFDDLDHYGQIIAVSKETIQLMAILISAVDEVRIKGRVVAIDKSAQNKYY